MEKLKELWNKITDWFWATFFGSEEITPPLVVKKPIPVKTVTTKSAKKSPKKKAK